MIRNIKAPALRWAMAAGLVLAPLAVHAAGALHWQETRLGLRAEPERQEVATDFAFNNPGPNPVTIVKIEPSCSCITAEVAPSILRAGDTGRLHAIFHVGDQTGSQHKTITVTTDEAGAQPEVLALSVEIIRYYSVTPRLLYWKAGADASERKIVCAAGSPRSILVSGVKCSLPEITAQIEATDPGRVYTITLHAAPRADHATAHLEVEIAIAGVGSRKVDAFAYYR